MSKIKALTIVSQPGVKVYIVGNTYNGLKLDTISDASSDTETNYVAVFIGRTRDNQTVFEAINAPMEIEYTEEKP